MCWISGVIFHAWPLSHSRSTFDTNGYEDEMHPVIINVGSEEADHFNYHHNNGLIWSLCLRWGQWGLCRDVWMWENINIVITDRLVYCCVQMFWGLRFSRIIPHVNDLSSHLCLYRWVLNVRDTAVSRSADHVGFPPRRSESPTWESCTLSQLLLWNHSSMVRLFCICTEKVKKDRCDSRILKVQPALRHGRH